MFTYVFLICFFLFTPLFAACPSADPFLRNIPLLIPEGGVVNTLNDKFFTFNSPQFKTDDFGDAVVVWRTFDGTRQVLQVATKQNGEDWIFPGDPRFPNNNLNYFMFPIEADEFTVDMDRVGNIVVVWLVFNGWHKVVQAAFKPAGGGDWIFPGNNTSPLLSDPRQPTNNLSYFDFSINTLPQVSIESGVVAITWEVFNGTNNVAQVAFKYPEADFRLPGDPRQQNHVLSPFFFNLVSPPQVAVDLCGNIAVTWKIYNRIKNVVQLSTKPFGLTTNFSKPGDPRFLPNVAFPFPTQPQCELIGIDSFSIKNGQVFIFWTLFDGTRNLLQAATIALDPCF
ncbi:MAG: hypothetical protein KDK55_02785 [Chlamydiia bacterium]|nr:hypothetical protein [Chlamydiia bacterium]